MAFSSLKDYFVFKYCRGLEVIDIRALAEQYGAPTPAEIKNCESIDIREMLRSYENFIGLERLMGASI